MKGRYVIALSALLTLGAVNLGKKMDDKKLEPLRSHTKTVEYIVQKDDKFKKLANDWIPKSIRKEYTNDRDWDIPYLYLMKLNGRTSSYLQIGETLKRPVYRTDSRK